MSDPYETDIVDHQKVVFPGIHRDSYDGGTTPTDSAECGA
jgi:hypothetical protein